MASADPANDPKNNKVGAGKRLWKWLFEPTMDVYADKPDDNREKRRQTKAASKAAETKKLKARPQKAAKKSKKKRKNLSEAELSLSDRGQRIGYVDKQNRVRLKANGQILGDAGGVSKEEALANFVERFDAYDSELANLEQAAQEPNIGLGQDAAGLRERISNEPGLGDTPSLLKRLDTIDESVQSLIEQQRGAKLRIVQAIDALPLKDDSNKPDWIASDRSYGNFVAEWSDSQAAVNDNDKQLATRFDNACSGYTERKDAYFHNHEANAKAKRLLLRQAKSVASGNEWDTAGEEFEALDRQWQAIGPADVEEDAKLRAQFNMTRELFFEEYADELAKKEELNAKDDAERDALLANLTELRQETRSGVLREQLSTASRKLDRLYDGGATSKASQALYDELEQKRRGLETKHRADRDQGRAKVNAGLVRAEKLAEADKHGVNWRDADQEFASIQQLVKTQDGVSKEERIAAETKLSTLRKSMQANRTAFFEQRDSEREKAGATKRALINDLPFYKNGATAADVQGHMNTSMEAWKKAGNAGRDVDDGLWEEYREGRQVLFDVIKQLREEEKDDHKANLSFAFERKREEIYKLEGEIGREELLAESTSDDLKAKKLLNVVERKRLRLTGLQNDLSSIQAKLNKMSTAKRKPGSSEQTESSDEAKAKDAQTESYEAA